MQLGSLTAGAEGQNGLDSAGLEPSGDQAGLLQKALGGHPGGTAFTPTLYHPVIQVCAQQNATVNVERMCRIDGGFAFLAHGLAFLLLLYKGDMLICHGLQLRL